MAVGHLQRQAVHGRADGRQVAELAATEAGTFVLEPQDLLFIPAHVSYRFANVGRNDACFLDVAAKAEIWPPTITYLD